MPTEPADRPEDTGTRRMVDLPEPELPPRTITTICLGCQGHGKVRMNVHDLLGESLFLIADDTDPVIVKFYNRLFAINPNLQEIFPPDLLTASHGQEDSPGAHQRDQLVNALVQVATLYGAGAREEAQLDQILRQAGRSHAMIQWPDGRVGPPTDEHWKQVGQALMETLRAVAGNRWMSAYDAAWLMAYDDAVTEMKHAIKHEGRAMQVPRQVRATAEHGGGPRGVSPR